MERQRVAMKGAKVLGGTDWMRRINCKLNLVTQLIAFM